MNSEQINLLKKLGFRKDSFKKNEEIITYYFRGYAPPGTASFITVYIEKIEVSLDPHIISADKKVLNDHLRIIKDSGLFKIPVVEI